MNKERYFSPSDRYLYDFKLCTSGKGWAQVDTSQDASYYGCWANPTELRVLSYAEGDVCLTKCDTEAEFIVEIRSIKSWNEENGYSFKGVDCLCNEGIIERFTKLGLAELLH